MVLQKPCYWIHFPRNDCKIFQNDILSISHYKIQPLYFPLLSVIMSRLKTNAKKKINKARVRVEKVVLMDVKKNIEQQKKRRAEMIKNRQRIAKK